MNSEEMESQDNDACVEGAEGETEVIICSNPDSKPNGKHTLLSRNPVVWFT